MKLSHETEPGEDGDGKARLCAMNREDNSQHIKRIKVEKDEQDEDFEVKRCRSELDEESISDEEIDVKNFETNPEGSSELGKEIDTDDSGSEIKQELNPRSVARCEQCHERFETQ